LDDSIDEMELDEQVAKPRRPGLPVEPRRLWWLLAEHRTLLVRAFVAAALVALVGFFLLPARYKSSAQLLYEGIPLLDPDERAQTPDAFVHSALALSRLREVRERLGWSVTLEDLRSQVTVELEASTSMRIVGKAGSAEDALALTQAVVEAVVPAAGVILAAGGSTRFPEPKQLLPWKGEPLVWYAVQAALESGLDPVVVVIGADGDMVRHALAGEPVDHGLRAELARAKSNRPDIGTGLSILLGQVEQAKLAAMGARQ